MKQTRMKVPIKYAVESGAWFQCHSDDFEGQGEKNFRLKVLSFKKVNLAEVDHPENMNKVKYNPDEGDWWVLKMQMINLNKINDFLQSALAIIDSDDFEFHDETDHYLSRDSNYANASGLANFWGHSFIPKIKYDGAISFFLPKDDNANYFITLKDKEGIIQEI